ncbi:MAG TPA: hypothetical protein VLM38_05955 [Blastocatellia bacterium]|nr:hypothetical protein [Blastocatellia bacterium]
MWVRTENQHDMPHRITARLRIVVVILVVILSWIGTSGIASAQKKKKKTARAKPAPTLTDRIVQAKADVIAAANDYKASLQTLLKLQEDDVKAAADTVEKRKLLLAQSVIAKKELEESERALSAAQGKVAETKRQMGDADNLIAEAKAEEQLARLGPSRLGAYQTTAALIRYNGPASWVLTDAAKVESYFAARFNHAMPISAYGQTPVHDHLGFDHRNAIDVAVSPDSAEGQGLMAYLRSAGIPFIAFRYAVPGSATGAHIHIGYPSKRLTR